MNISNQIIEVIDNLCQKFGIVIDWTSENIMPYLTEFAARFIYYDIATSVAWIVLFVSLFIASLIYFKVAHKNKVDFDTYDITAEQVNWVISLIFLCITIILLIAAVPIQIFDIIKAYTIPEMVIVDYIKSYLS